MPARDLIYNARRTVQQNTIRTARRHVLEATYCPAPFPAHGSQPLKTTYRLSVKPILSPTASSLMYRLHPQIPAYMLPQLMGGASEPPFIPKEEAVSPPQQETGSLHAPDNSDINDPPSMSGPSPIEPTRWPLPPGTVGHAPDVSPGKMFPSRQDPSSCEWSSGWYYVWSPRPYVSPPRSAVPLYAPPDAWTVPPAAPSPPTMPPTPATSTPAPRPAVPQPPHEHTMHVGACHEPDKFAEGLRE